MKISNVTKGRGGQTVSVEGADEVFPVHPSLDISRFKGKDVKALILRNRVVVGVEHNNGSVTGERS